jgi:hypothetical protein
MAEVGTQRPVDEAPLENRMVWVWVVLPVVWTVNWLRWADDAPVLFALGMVLLWTWAIGRVIALRRWRVTWDGDVVEITALVSRWRFRPNDVTAIVVPTVVTTCALIRARPLERTVLGIPWPWPFPWARATATYVRPEWFDEVVGISPGFVRRSPVGRALAGRSA